MIPMENKRKILLVEDNPDDVELMLHALKEEINISNSVDVVSEGAEALDYLFMEGKYENYQDHQLPTVVLLDIKLPKISGFEVLERIRAHERTRLIPVILLTSSKEEQDLIDGYSLGCNSYICKPIEFEEFTEAVKKIGLYWLLVNEPPILKKRIK